MSSDYEQLLAEAAELPDGRPKVALLEEAIREADAEGDLEGGFRSRMALVDAASFGGADDKAIVAFSWCLSKSDAHPGRFDSQRLLWRFKWIMADLPSFPSVSRERIFAMLDDLERRFRAAGSSMRPVHMLRFKMLRRLGDVEAAAEQFRLWQSAPRDHLSDCPACERASEAHWHSLLRKDEAALEAAAPLVSRRLSCHSEPHCVLGTILLPLMRLGRWDEAHQWHLWGWRLIISDSHHIGAAADHLRYLTAIGDYRKALRVFQRFLPSAVAVPTHDDRFDFYLASTLLLDTAAPRSRTPRKLNLPPSLACWSEQGRYDLAELAAFFERHAAELAARFDRRNGNNTFTTELATRREVYLPEKP